MKLFTFLITFLLLAASGYSQTVSFEDQVFKDYLIGLGIDNDGDGEIQLSEAEAITELRIQDSGASSFKGIKAFINLEGLTIENEQVERLDLSGHESLLWADLLTTRISVVDFSNCTALTGIMPMDICDSLLLPDCPMLTALDLENTEVSFVDIRNCSSLIELSRSAGPPFPLFEVAGCSSLLSIAGGFNFSSLSNLPSLRWMLLDTDQKLEVNNCPSLESMDLQDADSDTILVTSCPSLEHFSIMNSNRQIDLISIKSCETLSSFDLQGGSVLRVDLSRLTSLQEFLSQAEIDFLDLSFCTSLTDLLSDGNINNINVFGAISLQSVWHFGPDLRSLDLTGCIGLQEITLTTNRLRALDLSWARDLQSVELEGLEELRSLNIANSAAEELWLNDLPNLTSICSDIADSTNIQMALLDMPWVSPDLMIATDCVSTAPPNAHILRGRSTLDIHGDTCKTSTTYLPFSKYIVDDNGVSDLQFFTNQEGRYQLFAVDGIYTYGPEVLYGDKLFVLTPETHTVDLTVDTLGIEQDFCYTPNLDIDIIDVTLIPLGDARPGFTAGYKINYKNTGNTTRGGDIKFFYDEALMDYVSTRDGAPSTQEDGFLAWSFDELIPYEEREIYFTMRLNSPMDDPALVGGEILDLSAEVGPLGNQTVSAYWSYLSQEVVNSFDPNDKRNLAGDVLGIEEVGDFVKYMIRFENTGTASAVNVVVTDTLDESVFDIASLEVIDASHMMDSRVEGNIVFFTFNEIFLPFDDANNDGYVVFMIKTKEDLLLGDVLENSAAIFFDFNFPIITNLDQTTVSDIVSVTSLSSSANFTYTISPNPTEGLLLVESDETLYSIAITTIDGRQLTQQAFSSQTARVDVSHLESGVYVITLSTAKGSVAQKFVKMH